MPGFRRGDVHNGTTFLNARKRWAKVAGDWVSVAGRWVKTDTGWLRYWPPVQLYNGYVTSTYTTTFTCATGTWGTPVFVSSSVQATMPAGINTWGTPSGLVSTGVFSSAAGTGDYNGWLGDC